MDWSLEDSNEDLVPSLPTPSQPSRFDHNRYGKVLWKRPDRIIVRYPY